MTKKKKPAGLLAPKDAVGAVVAPKAFEHLAEAIRVYLDAVGWHVVVVGSPRVQWPGAAPFNYEFVVKFTGGARQKKPFIGREP